MGQIRIKIFYFQNIIIFYFRVLGQDHEKLLDPAIFLSFLIYKIIIINIIHINNFF